MTYKNTIISLSLLTAIGLAAWTTFLFYRPQSAAAIQTVLMPDALMEEVTAVIMDKQGKPRMKIVTPKMVHYADNDTTHLTAPQFLLYRKSPQPWVITAKYAKAIQGINHIDFWEEVTIYHSADKNNPSTLIKTPKLTVHPEKQIAETNDLITLIQPNIVVKATGMYADMNTGDIKLLSQTRTEYVSDS